MEIGLGREDLMSISRVKGELGVIFFSDVTTVDAKYLEDFACDPSVQASPKSKFISLREAPTDHDWEVWRNFWHQYTR